MKILRRVVARIDPYLILLFVLSGFALAPVFAPGYFYGAHDGRHSVFYLTQFDASIRDGALWPRWAMHHIQGYGYPTFIIQAPLGFYVGEFFMLLGAGPTLAAKFSWVVAFLAGAWGIYRLVCTWLNLSPYSTVIRRPGVDAQRMAAVVAGLLYVYIPYHLADIYVRGALNDTLLLAWFPWVILAFDRLVVLGGATGWARRLALAILLLAGTLLTHTFALISFTPLLITFVIYRLLLAWWRDHRERKTDGEWRASFARIGLAAGAGLGALLLYSTFLLPLLVEGQHLEQQVYVTDTYDYRNHFVQVSQFFSPFWGFGFSDDPLGANDGMSFQVGLMALLFAAGAIYLLLRARPLQSRHRAIMLYLLLATLGLLVVMTPLAAPLWAAFPALGIIQFPWRLLALVALTISPLAGLVAGNLMDAAVDRSSQVGGAALLALLVILAGAPYVGAELEPVEAWREDGRAIFRFEQEHPDMIAYTEWVGEPFSASPMTVDYGAEIYAEAGGEAGPLTRLAVLDGAGRVLSSYSRGSSGGGLVEMEQDGVVRVHLYYFPGWQARVDGQLVEHRPSAPDGVIEVDVAAGEHQIDVRMGATPVRRLGSAISWAMLVVVMGLLVWDRRGR